MATASPSPKATAPAWIIQLWGADLIETGYTVVPSILLWGQGRLKLSNSELAVLVQLISHRWAADADPHPEMRRLRSGEP